MLRPRFTLARVAIIGAGLLAGAGVGAVAVSHVMGSSPVASITTTTPTPQATPAPSAAAPVRGTRAGQELRTRLVTLVAQQTGTSVAAVRGQVKAGRTLEAIAEPDAQAVEAAALQAITSTLDSEVAAGTITQAQESAQLARARTGVTRAMAALPRAKGTPPPTPAP